MNSSLRQHFTSFKGLCKIWQCEPEDECIVSEETVGEVPNNTVVRRDHADSQRLLKHSSLDKLHLSYKPRANNSLLYSPWPTLPSSLPLLLAIIKGPDTSLDSITEGMLRSPFPWTNIFPCFNYLSLHCDLACFRTWVFIAAYFLFTTTQSFHSPSCKSFFKQPRMP